MQINVLAPAPDGFGESLNALASPPKLRQWESRGVGLKIQVSEHGGMAKSLAGRGRGRLGAF